ncbi:MAG: cytosine/adenosine deaminase-related metal-dependent hydrolase, partial [Saprospiraceae bacterium]
NTVFQQSLAVYEELAKPFNADDISMVPHAPYSVSKDLFKMLDEVNSEGSTVSIHNQEVAAEDQLFRYSNGRFIDFYEFMNLKTESIPLTGMSSLHYALSNMNPAMNTLLVHNTMCEAEDIEAALNWSLNIYWVTCPNANLYIENKLPDYRMMLSKEVKMCIGSDSLSSNGQLSIFEEMKTIKKYQSTINDLDLIRWATVNGAEALGYNDLGRIEKGLAPGLNLIEVEVNDGIFDLRKAKCNTKIV